MDLNFVRCTAGDIEILFEISRQTFIDAFEEQNDPQDFWEYMDEAFNKEVLLTQLKKQDSHFYFAFIENKLAGYFKINESGAQSDINDPDSIELERIYVLKDFQGRRIGEKLLKKVISLSKEKKVKFIWLGVWEHNPGAIKFYKRNGFKKFGEHPYAIGKDIQTDWLMRLEI
ncbi:GNAT family N-acetyltransferase [Abyssalbus ytuae]|uniref:GNAT family N-acetyltransferase n=1 Tax=Abyssalbus ytuae TaxID=2926907 RepID=A0A9E7A3Y3_9FLAO|nr:GNAT family N-acetyltransferase [Abyssalbus ytuae]UOB19446.1 GNAT family N-acetyltransferase [Abyssalbus ytuae]